MLDVNLPDISGLEVCRRMRAHAHGRHLAILQISSAAIDAKSQVSALEGGADAFLVEPVDAGVLVATTRALLRLRAAEEAAREASTRLGLAQEAARSGVWDYDITANRLWWSREANDVMGLPRDAQPQFDESIEYIDPRDREATSPRSRRRWPRGIAGTGSTASPPRGPTRGSTRSGASTAIPTATRCTCRGSSSTSPSAGRPRTACGACSARRSRWRAPSAPTT